MSSTVVPGLRYHDAPKAIRWLCDAFGFEAGLVVEPEPGMIAHAQLVHGTGMVMLGSALEDEFAHQVATVRATGKPTAAIYVVVEDVEGHAERARAAGAEITIEPTMQDYGGSNYTCRDFEGNLWSFGSYNPWTD
jgi:uncharacterized glyoxalase superfamily protein PhnB